MTPLHRTPHLVVVFLLALLVTACTTNDDNPPPTTKPPSQESQVEAAYLAFWDMAKRLAGTPDADDPELSKRASGDALRDLTDGLRSLEEQGRHSEFGQKYGHDVLATEVKGTDAATVRDCAVDDSRIVDSSGQIVVEGVGTQLLAATLRRDGERWLVDSIEQLDSWNGAVPCQ